MSTIPRKTDDAKTSWEGRVGGMDQPVGGAHTERYLYLYRGNGLGGFSGAGAKIGSGWGGFIKVP